MTRRSSVVSAPTVARKPCRHGCGTDVDTFVDEIGLRRQLDTTPPAVTVDLYVEHPRLWEYRGENIGWCQPFSPVRTRREFRLEHECANTPKRERKRKNKSKE